MLEKLREKVVSPKLKRKDGKMLKLQTSLPSFKRSQNAAFSADKNSAQIYKSHPNETHSGFIMHSQAAESMSGYNVTSNAVIKSQNRINMNKKTAKNVNFSGLSVLKPMVFPEGAKLSKNAWKLSQSKLFNKFIEFADKSPALFEALFALFITCGMRPAAIGLQTNEHNKQKNKKAASHSISSGIIGYGFAYAVFKPIQIATDKVVKNPDKFSKGLKEFLTYSGQHLMKSSDRTGTLKSIFKYGPQIFTAGARSAITIAMIPWIDKYILNRFFDSNTKPVTKEELKDDPTYKYAFINFKNNTKASKIFQNFSGVMK